VRACAAGAGTLVIGLWLKDLPPAIGIPGCVVLFSVLAGAVGLVTRSDIAALARLVVRRPPAQPDPAPALTS